MPVFVPLFMVPVDPELVVPVVVDPVEPEPVVVPVEPEPVVEFVVCAFAFRAMPATSIQPIIITFFMVESFVYQLLDILLDNTTSTKLLFFVCQIGAKTAFTNVQRLKKTDNYLM